MRKVNHETIVLSGDNSTFYAYREGKRPYYVTYDFACLFQLLSCILIGFNQRFIGFVWFLRNTQQLPK